jgi:hypothetical protein
MLRTAASSPGTSSPQQPQEREKTRWIIKLFNSQRTSSSFLRMIGLRPTKGELRLEVTVSQSMSQSRPINTRLIGIWSSILMTQWSSPSREKIAIPPTPLELLPRPLSQLARLLLLKTKIMLSITHNITKEVVTKKAFSQDRHKSPQFNRPRPEMPMQVVWCPQALPDPW